MPVNASSQKFKTEPVSKTILFLNENPLPKIFTQGTIAGKELRLRAAIRNISQISVISRPGVSMHDPTNNRRGPLEKKIHVRHTVKCPYYLSGLILFIYGFAYCLKHKPSSIEAESPHISGPAVVLLGWIFGIPSIIELRASYREIVLHRFSFIPFAIKRFLIDQIVQSILKLPSGVIVNSKYYHRQLLNWGISSVVINPGVQNIKLMSQRWRKVDKDAYVLGFMGRLVPEKGGLVLAKAFVLVSHQLPSHRIHLEIAGTGPEKKQFAKIIHAAGLMNRVTFLGWMRSSYALSRWDLLINPNLVTHPLEMVNVEAAYCGVPVICFGNRDVPETVVHLQTGFKVRQQTPEALAQAIEHVIQNPELQKRLSSNGKRFVELQFSFKQQVKRLLHYYQQLGILNSYPKSPQQSH